MITSSNFSNILRKCTPEYLIPYQEGFEEGKAFALKTLSEAMLKIQKEPSVTETTSTSELNPEIGDRR